MLLVILMGNSCANSWPSPAFVTGTSTTRQELAITAPCGAHAFLNADKVRSNNCWHAAQAKHAGEKQMQP